ncbi:MAG: TadE/TadG family type IV pilus assembly protein [Erythrobacter sp.]|uniref:TadE/TadG family type IV pilus assembly protein n=1 Tax=Erythrobacter sp. HL-111 TaxID=1798193 RepID=UPI0006DA4FB0|nr:TadE family protein [Erythrobacter sp. HL-111]KPP96670.1 MAG: Tad secretion system assembly protein TadE [Erythrobacteraceae bacterium HL-111]SDR97913.1 TadE-like protein [Erythrobacter sp. HL-111]
MTRHLFGRLARERDGVTIVEFAFVAPVMFMLLLALLEMGYVAFARSTLESAILVASRESKVAECPAQTAELIEEELMERLAVVSTFNDKPPKLEVRSYGTNFRNVGNPEPFNDIDGSGTWDPGESYQDINGNGQWDDDMGKEGNFGQFGEVVEFSASMEVVSLVPFVAQAINGNEGFYALSAETVVRNEPFKDAEC